MTAFDSLLDYIESDLEFATSYYNNAYLDRRITARMRRIDCEEYAEYAGELEANPAEREALLDALSINVTGFFRNPTVWDSLRSVLRSLTERDRRVTIWSTPCSDGREPYSLAMLALDDENVDASRIDVLATDIDLEALAVARKGRYEVSTTDDIEDELAHLDDPGEYVDRDGEAFQITDQVRQLVSFDRHDLIRDPAPGDFELILCRNLLIYIQQDYQEQIFDTLDAALTEHGYLVIGKTETLPPSFKPRYIEVADGSGINCRRSAINGDSDDRLEYGSDSTGGAHG